MDIASSKCHRRPISEKKTQPIIIIKELSIKSQKGPRQNTDKHILGVGDRSREIAAVDRASSIFLVRMFAGNATG